ncbi:MAG TPA: RNA polymerase sigma factor [Bryobacteraceae bacterium]|nr:RNA polymerase sigma factor [Bryobacteraceae bacterium]
MKWTPESLTDEALMSQLCAAADHESADPIFQEVFARYHARVVCWCYRIAKNRDAAHDLAQEVFLKAYRHRSSFRGDSRLSTWLYAITRNHCLSAIKKQGNDTVQYDPAVHSRLRDLTAIEPDRAAETRELCDRMLRLMERTLEPMEIRVMALHYGHEIPLAIITRDLELHNPSGAKAYIVNARRKLSGVIERRGWTGRRKRARQAWTEEVAA